MVKYLASIAARGGRSARGAIGGAGLTLEEVEALANTLILASALLLSFAVGIVLQTYTHDDLVQADKRHFILQQRLNGRDSE